MARPKAQIKPATGARQIRDNATAAQKCALGANGNCAFCQRVGQPILPLRYTVVPTYLDKRPRNTLAGYPTLGTELGTAFKAHEFAVRALRGGFLHVYLGRPGFWQVYAVTADGMLRLLADPDSPDEKADREMTAACSRDGHNIPASFIHIPVRFQSGTIHIAFASQAWSRATRSRYEKEPWSRMQSFDCEALASRDTEVIDAFKVAPDGSNLGGIVEEYVADNAAASSRRRYPTAERVDEDRNGRLDEGPGIWASAHGFYPRIAQSAKVGDLVSQYAIDTDKLGKVRKVSAVVLNDAVGIAQETNTTRLRCVEWLGKYVSHPTIVRPQMVSKSISALKKIVEASAGAALTAAETKNKTPDVVSTFYPSDEFGNGTTVSTTRAERIETARRSDWSRLAARYDEGARATFQSKYDKDVAQFESFIADSDADWALWVADPRWLKWFDDYDVSRHDEAANLVQLCAPCLAGGLASKQSRAIWDKWLNGDPSALDNPVYRGLFARQKTLLDFLTPDGFNAFGDNSDAIDKADNSYDALKGFVGAEQFASYVSEPLMDGAAKIQSAMTSAAIALGDSLGKRGEQIMLRAQQAALKVYANVEVTLLRVQMTVGEYHKFLSGQAFRRLESAVNDLVKAGSRSVRSIALGGILAIRDPVIRDTVIDVTIWTLDNAAKVQAALRRASNATGQFLSATQAQLSAALRQVRVHAFTLGHDSARLLRRLGAGMSLRASQVGQFARDVAGKTARVAGVAASGELMLAIGAVFFQAWSFKDGWKEMQGKFGREKTESLLGVMADGVGVIAGAVEAAGVILKGFAARVGVSLAARLTAWSAGLMSTAGWMAVGASVIEGVQALMMSKRTFESGDRDASAAYLISGALFLAGAAYAGVATAAGTASLFGPFGIAIALLLLAVVALWWAMSAEDTQAEIWLDRCYFGYGKRREGKWTDAQLGEEVTELNAVLLGLNAQLDWEDKFGMDKVAVRLTMPGFDSEHSGYEYTVSVRDSGGRWIAATGGRVNRPAPPQYMSAWDGSTRTVDPEEMFDFSDRGSSSVETDPAGGKTLVVEKSFRVSDALFSATKVRFEYWADTEDEAAVSTIEHVVED